MLLAELLGEVPASHLLRACHRASGISPTRWAAGISDSVQAGRRGSVPARAGRKGIGPVRDTVASGAARCRRAVKAHRLAKVSATDHAGRTGRQGASLGWAGPRRHQPCTGRKDLSSLRQAAGMRQRLGGRAGSGLLCVGRAGPWVFGPPTCRKACKTHTVNDRYVRPICGCDRTTDPERRSKHVRGWCVWHRPARLEGKVTSQMPSGGGDQDG